MSNQRQFFDPSLIAALASGSTPQASAPATTVADFLTEALTRIVDFVAGGDSRSGQVCVEGDQFPTWVRIQKFGTDNGVDKFWASTNDGDLFIGEPPTLSVSDTDPGVVLNEAARYLIEKFAGKDAVTVRLFQSERNCTDILEGNSTNGTFAAKPELPSI